MFSHLRNVGILSLSLGLVWAGPIVERQIGPPTAVIASGTVVGTTTSYPGATATTNKFLGIPYAKSPPVRFGLPEAAARWVAPLMATRYKPICYQEGGNVFGNTSPESQVQSEDCLYANVYQPAGTTPTSAKPVMFWIYGGNQQSGDASEPLYDASLLAANHDVVVVTFNYRLNVFGFSNAPEIPVSQQNVGFYDQRFALQWVRTNIAAFGGDPNKVTIFGESAGGQAIRNLVALPPTPQVYRAAIIESEQTILPGNGTLSWQVLAASLGCPIGTGSLACVRAADANAISASVNNKLLIFPLARDGITALDDDGIANAFSSGRAAPVPILIGTNAQEGSIAAYALGLNGGPFVDFVRTLANFLPQFGQQLANQTSDTMQTNVVFDLATQFFTQGVFQCRAAQLADWAQRRGSPLWRYYFNASFPNTTPFRGAGAYHSAELFEIFGTYPRAGATQQQINLSTYMRTAWTNFAKNPTAGPGWTAYGSQKIVGDLGGNGSSGERDIRASDIDTLCPLFDALGGANRVLQSLNATSDATNVLLRLLREGARV